MSTAEVVVHLNIDTSQIRRALIEACHDWAVFAELFGWTPTIRHHRKRRVRARRLAIVQHRRHRPARCWRCNPRGNPPSTTIRRRA